MKLKIQLVFFWLSKETSILINNWFMMYFLSVVLIGTVYPIFLEAITNEKISVGPPYFNQLIIPFLIPFLIVMALGPKLEWIKNKKIKVKLTKIILFVVSIFISYLIVRHFSTKVLYLTILFSKPRAPTRDNGPYALPDSGIAQSLSPTSN